MASNPQPSWNPPLWNPFPPELQAPFTILLKDKDSRKVVAAVALSYLLWTAALVWIGIWDFLNQSCGIPAAGVACLLPVSFLFGWTYPWHQPEPEEPKEPKEPIATPLWSPIGILGLVFKVWSFLYLWLFIDYLRYGSLHPALSSSPRVFFPIIVVAVAVAGVTQWTFVQFFRDIYGNISWPALGVFPLASSYLACLILKIPLPVGPYWLIFFAISILYTIVMVAPRPFYPVRNPSFMYWVFLLTLCFFVVAVIGATKAVAPPSTKAPPPIQTVPCTGGTEPVIGTEPAP